MPLQYYQEVTSNKRTYIKFVVAIGVFIICLYAVYYIVDNFFGSRDRQEYLSDLNNRIATIRSSVGLSQGKIDFLKELSRQCSLDANFAQFSDSQTQLDHINNILTQEQCGPFINVPEYEPIEVLSPDQARGGESNPFSSFDE